MSDDRIPARVLPFAQKPRPRPKPPTRPASFLDPGAGLTIDVTVRKPDGVRPYNLRHTIGKPTEPDKG